MKAKVLLLGETAQGSTHLAARLEKYGCDCWFATSYEEAWSLFSVLSFDLVLSPLKLRGESLFPLVSALEGSDVSLFYFQPVEESCWWLPALDNGKKCFGSNAMRPSEFIAALEENIQQIWSVAPPLTETLPYLGSRPSRSLLAMARKDAALPPARPARADSARLVSRKAVVEISYR